jgi:hypothetical protein
MGSIAALGALRSTKRGSRDTVYNDAGEGLYGTFRMGSNRMANSKGIIEMARSMYGRDPDWAIAMVSTGWNLATETAEAMVSGFSPYMIEEGEEGPTVVFTYGPPGSKRFHPRPSIYVSARNFFQTIKDGNFWTRDPYGPGIVNRAEEAGWIELAAKAWFEAIQNIPGATDRNHWGKERGIEQLSREFWEDKGWGAFPYTTMASDDELSKRIAAAIHNMDNLLHDEFSRYTTGWKDLEVRKEATKAAMKFGTAGTVYHEILQNEYDHAKNSGQWTEYRGVYGEDHDYDYEEDY